MQSSYRLTAAFLLALACSGAQAQSWGFGLAAGRGWQPEVTFGTRLGSGTLGVRLTPGSGEISYGQLLTLPPLGMVETRSQAGALWAGPAAGAWHTASQASASVGPIALRLAGNYHTAALTEWEPLAAWTLEPSDTRTQGWNLRLDARVRQEPQRFLLLGGEAGGSPMSTWPRSGRCGLRRLPQLRNQWCRPSRASFQPSSRLQMKMWAG
ncbi:hypothetical protein ACFP81_03510 [Deinococcus lacus]|uniref:Uncharacterized protein n=1 Tax=Deinococcus lacus TaxID=392561 RepID=A0ABW1YAG0_9DEIO